MKKETTKINFDLSILSLSELIKIYEDISTFLETLEKSILPLEEKGKK